MKKNRSSIFSKLIISYFVFAFVVIVALVAFLVMAVIDTAKTGSYTGDYPYISFDEEGVLQNSEELAQIGGWAELLSADNKVLEVYGDKQNDKYEYENDEIIDCLSNSLSLNFAGDYRIYFHAKDDNRYLIYYPKGVFQIVYNVGSGNMVYTPFNKWLIVFLLLALAAEVYGISRFVSRRITKPMDSLSEGMKRVASGEENVTIPEFGEKEFAGIRESFLKMNEELNKQKAEKEELIKRRQQMLLELSHDIKTPVATIKSYATALSENMVPEEELKNYYQKISMKADRVNDLTMDMFTMLKLESEDYVLSKEKLNLSEMLRNILADLYEDVVNDGFDMDIEIPEEDLYVMGDLAYLTRSVENLVNNARKYNVSGNKILIKLATEEKYVSLAVKDDGQEIEQETKEKMFIPFARGEKSRKSDGGTGLGLAITNQIIHKHEGRLTYKYEDEMNCFTIEIPMM